MKFRRLAILVVIASVVTLARAQDEDNKRPPTEIPDFSNLDEYIYEPKSSVQLSFRHLSGAKTQFFGTGTFLSPEGTVGAISAGPNIARVYHDGAVNPDSRTASTIDSGGNPVTDPNAGSSVGTPVSSDGKTDSWNYINPRQLNEAPLGYIMFHSYSAEVTDTARHPDQSKSTNGLDLAVVRDMGKFWNGRLAWNLVAGMSVNDISSKRSDNVPVSISQTIHYYSTFGQNVPAAPFTSPTSTSQATTGGQSYTDYSGVLIGNLPSYETTTIIPGQALDTWKLKGAFYTFRAGPQLAFAFFSRFHLTISAGAVLVYSGTNYTVTQVLQPDFGNEIVEVDTNHAYKVRPGYFADASLGFDLTDKASFFAGAVFQSAQGYTQELHTTTASYATKIDLTNESGFRAGMSIRF